MFEVGDIVIFQEGPFSPKILCAITGFKGDFVYAIDSEGVAHYAYMGFLEHAGYTVNMSSIINELKGLAGYMKL